MNAIKNTIKIWGLASQGVGFRNQLISFFCARYGNISRDKKNIRRILYLLIGLFGKNSQISIKFRISRKICNILLRKGNMADYLVFGEMVMGGYIMQNAPSVQIAEIHDGGANIGLFSIYAYANYPKALITCYEPDEENITQLKLNLKANQIDATVISKALWSKSAELFFHPGESYSGFVSEEKSPYPISCICPSITDNSWLKLDIEGAEYEVLPALFRAACKPSIISIEIHDFRGRGGSLLKLISENGYTWKETFGPNEECIALSAYKKY